MAIIDSVDLEPLYTDPELEPLSDMPSDEATQTYDDEYRTSQAGFEHNALSPAAATEVHHADHQLHEALASVHGLEAALRVAQRRLHVAGLRAAGLAVRHADELSPDQSARLTVAPNEVHRAGHAY